MRKQTVFTCFLSLVLAIVLCAAGHAAALRTTLPLEVMGTEGTTKTALVLLTRPATTLTLKIHGLENEQEGSVRIGLAPWLPLTNSAVTVAEPGRSYGGIGGGFSTLTITMPLTPAQGRLGLATLQFRFNHTDGVNFGFRVLAFNFLDKSGAAILPTSAFTQHDPGVETAPLTNPADIAVGKTLWHSARLVEEPGAKFILASCASCHSEDGRDLKYYGYSNNSIYERCLFHGLSHMQAEQIVSYIRSLPVGVYGRPWNPPYQPGPGMDSKPIAQWAAGAGLSAVLPSDTAMLAFLFPLGIRKEGIGTQDTLNMRELPIALQLPDWNHWLPRTHPKDGFGDAFSNSLFAAFYDGTGLNQDSHGNLAGILANADPAYHQWFSDSADAPLYHYLGYWTHALQGTWFQQQEGSANWTPEFAEDMQSAAQWRAVKEWYLMQLYGMEGNAPHIFPTASGAPIAGESHSWLSGALFEVSPAAVGIPENGVYVSNLLYEYRTNVWYYVQVVVDSGNRHRQGWDPVDWGYAGGRAGNLAQVSGQPCGLRLTAMLIKGMQQCDTNGTLDTTYGWFPHFAGDMRFFLWGQPYAGVSADAWAQIATAVAGAQQDKMEQFSPAEWRASEQGQNVVLYGGDPLQSEEQQTVDALTALGVDPALIARKKAFDTSVWGQP